MGWLTENEEGQRMGKIIEGILMFFGCCIFIGSGLIALMLPRPEIQSAISYVLALIL